MEIFLPLTKFFQVIVNDARISPAHISLSMALLQEWNLSGGVNPVTVNRQQVMRLAKICGRSTYNKCINDLYDFGYITYTPSVNTSRKSIVRLNFLV